MKTKILFLSLFIISFSLITSFAQTPKIDSLLKVLQTAKEDTGKVNSLNELSWQLRERGNLDNALIRGEDAKRLAVQINFKKGVAKAYSIIGIIYNDQGNNTEALKNNFACLKIREEIGDKSGIANSYTNIGNAYDDQGNYTEALKNNFAALKIKKEIGDKQGIASSYNNIGAIYKEQGNYQEALKNFFASLKTREEIGNKQGIAMSYGNIGIVFRIQGNYPEALKNHFASLKIMEEIGDKKGIAASYNSIGLVYFNQDNYPEALKNYLAALKIEEEIRYKKGIAESYHNIGNVYKHQGNYLEALKNQFAALKIEEEIGYKQGIAISYGNIGNVYNNQQNYPEALKNYFAALKIEEEIGDKEGIAVSYIGIGYIFTRQKKYKEAEEELIIGRDISKEIGYKEALRESYSGLAQLDSAMGNYKSAYENHKLYIIYRDSLFNEENTKKTVQSQMNYDFDKKEALTKAEQEKKDAIALKEMQRQKLVRNGFIGGFALMLLLAGSIFFNLQQNKKKNKIITAQKIEVEEKNREITQSIDAALRIQTAILPPARVVKQFLLDSFILYMPKDIVAGDFYWMETVNDIVLFAACDCTGHGVPGAMVSVMCHGALNRSVREFGLTQPAEILDKVTEIVKENFASSESIIQDGMDASLCAYYPQERKLQWAGANNPLWLIRERTIIEYKPDKQPIGNYEYRKPFTNHEIELLKGDTIYIFSDGYQDQFGGDGNKKLTKKGLRNMLLSIQDKAWKHNGKNSLTFITIGKVKKNKLMIFV